MNVCVDTESASASSVADVWAKFLEHKGNLSWPESANAVDEEATSFAVTESQVIMINVHPSHAIDDQARLRGNMHDKSRRQTIMHSAQGEVLEAHVVVPRINPQNKIHGVFFAPQTENPILARDIREREIARCEKPLLLVRSALRLHSWG